MEQETNKSGGATVAADTPQLLDSVGLAVDSFVPSVRYRLYDKSDLPERVRRDPYPIPHWRRRANIHRNQDFSYWLSGLVDAQNVVDAAAGRPLRRIYDFGGSTGRVFRHFFCQWEGLEVWSSDIEYESFRWNQMHMPQGIRVFRNTPIPSLPIADCFFDVVTAFSVFTHIDETESQWLLELRRILRRGGLLYLTIQDENFWMNASDRIVERVQRSPNREVFVRGVPMPMDRVAFHHSHGTLTFHRTDYVRREWARYFDIVDIKPVHDAQTVVTMTYET